MFSFKKERGYWGDTAPDNMSLWPHGDPETVRTRMINREVMKSYENSRAVAAGDDEEEIWFLKKD